MLGIDAMEEDIGSKHVNNNKDVGIAIGSGQWTDQVNLNMIPGSVARNGLSRVPGALNLVELETGSALSDVELCHFNQPRVVNTHLVNARCCHDCMTMIAAMNLLDKLVPFAWSEISSGRTSRAGWMRSERRSRR